MKKAIIVFVSCLLLPPTVYSQFPAACNIEENLQSKTCCPNDCGARSNRGSCVNVTQEVMDLWENADPTVVRLLKMTPTEREKNTADARYLWPTVVFENVCQCNENFGGFDCMECDFGWTGADCQTQKASVVRRKFSSLSQEEKDEFIDATRQLKSELGIWSVIVEEPKNYTFGTAKLQNVSTYNFFIYLHEFSARDGVKACTAVNENITINFAHKGPVFPVWHRRYILTVEKEFQRIMNNEEFGFPYWQWEEDDRSPFELNYYGRPSNLFSTNVENVDGILFDSDEWNTVCDLTYWNRSLTCSSYWKPCNPERDLAVRRPLQRGGGSTYLPSRDEVMIAIAAPSYDAANPAGNFGMDSSRASFRSRLEGWNNICSASICVGTGEIPKNSTFTCRMHNNVHDWVGGQMDTVPAAVNDPIFNMHHCNVDRILESWMKRFARSDPLNSESQLLPYVPISGAHPGHNRNDYIIPFFPLIKVSRQYSFAEDWGYIYDSLIPADIDDRSIADCEILDPLDSCPICAANGTCINCNDQTCPAPLIGPDQPEAFSPNSDSATLGVGLGLGLGLGILLLLAILTIIALIIHSKRCPKVESGENKMEMTVKS